MAWYGGSWPVEQHNYNREQVADERQMWQQNMDASNHVAFQHFQNFAPYRHNMVNVAAVPGFAGVKFPDSQLFSQPQPSCVFGAGNEIPSTSSKNIPTEPPPPKNNLHEHMQPSMKVIPPPIQEPQPPPQQQMPEPVLLNHPVPKSPDLPPPVPSKSKPSTSKPESRKVKKRGRKPSKKKAASSPTSDEAPATSFQCLICEKRFEFEASLKTHSILHRGGGHLYRRALIEKSISQKEKMKKSLAKTFQCKECGDWFSQNRTLAKHMKIHTGESSSVPPTLPILDKTFR